MTQSTPRQRRIYRAQCASYLLSLEAPIKADELRTLDWKTLESLPHWCFYDEAQFTALQQICGALFLAPVVQRWIDGRRIQAFRTLVGESLFQAVLNYPLFEYSKGKLSDELPNFAINTECDLQNAPADRSEPDPDALDISQMLLEPGTAVMLGAIQQPALAGWLGAELSRLGRFASTAASAFPPLPVTVAQPLYHDALSLYEHIHVQAQPQRVSAAPATESGPETGQPA